MKKTLILFYFSIISQWAVAQVNLTESQLPIIIIKTTNGQTIPDEPKITADMQIIWNGNGQLNRITDVPNHYNNKVGIEMRGSTSQSLSEKKPYSIELRDAAGKELEIGLLGMPKNDDWALVAPYSDKTLVRDALMYQLGGKMMAWGARTRHCEVIVNGKYQGVYVLTERIKRGKDRVNIEKMDSTMLSGNNLTGGYIVKIDKSTGNPAGYPTSWTSNFTNSNGKKTSFQYHYPKPEDIKSEQRQYIRNAVNEMETAMNGANFADPSVGYAKYWDVNSLIDFFILNELSRNVDGYRLSTYFYKNRNSIDSKFKMGPIWDFNIALGNANYCSGGSFVGWAYRFNDVCPNDSWGIPFWWEKLLSDFNFKRMLRERWNKLRQNELAIPQLNNTIDSMVNAMGSAVTRNFQTYPILSKYIWPNSYIGNTYTNEITYLKTWLSDRIKWLDDQMMTFPTGRQEVLEQAIVYPNPSSSGFNFDFVVKNNERIKLLITNDLGQVVYQKNYDLQTGYQQITWKDNALPNGIYFYQLFSNEKIRLMGKLMKKG